VFRIVTYNIRAGLGLDGVRSIRRIGDVLASLNPDVVCLQEVDQHVLRSWLSNQPKFLSTRLGMQVMFQRNLRYGVGGFGNCILVKPLIMHCRCHSLPADGEPRGLVEVTAAPGGHEVTIFCTHLSTEKEVRVRQAKEVVKIVKAVHGPHVLCGDMNDVMGSETLSTLLDDPVLRDSSLEIRPTYTPLSTKDHRKIDFVLADLRFEVKDERVIDTNASDHLPVVVDLEAL